MSVVVMGSVVVVWVVSSVMPFLLLISVLVWLVVSVYLMVGLVLVSPSCWVRLLVLLLSITV